jgi:hypothetical protein
MKRAAMFYKKLCYIFLFIRNFHLISLHQFSDWGNEPFDVAEQYSVMSHI